MTNLLLTVVPGYESLTIAFALASAHYGTRRPPPPSGYKLREANMRFLFA
jgi:hypothetical protein